MDKTINFCGDSFCANSSEKSWIVQLSNMLNAKLNGTGKDGSAYEHAIKSFNPDDDITVFCWTESSRIYHPTVSLNQFSCEEMRSKNKIYEAGYQFFRYLHNPEYSRERQIRDLYWFDNEILYNYKGLAVSLWGFWKTYDFKYAHTIDMPSLKSFSVQAPGSVNHTTEEMNTLLAKKIYNFIIKLTAKGI